MKLVKAINLISGLQFVSNLRIKNFQIVVTNHGVTTDLTSDAIKNPSITSATIATTTRPATNSNMFIDSAVYTTRLCFQD